MYEKCTYLSWNESAYHGKGRGYQVFQLYRRSTILVASILLKIGERGLLALTSLHTSMDEQIFSISGIWERYLTKIGIEEPAFVQ